MTPNGADFFFSFSILIFPSEPALSAEANPFHYEQLNPKP